MKRRKRMTNVQDNILRADQMWGPTESSTQRRAPADVEWRQILEARVILLENFNVYSLKWNLYCRNRRNAAWLETLIEYYDLISTNETGRPTRPTRGQATSIIDLTFSTPELGALDSCVFHEKLATSSDHVRIVFDTANLNETIGNMDTSQKVNGGTIKTMSEDKLEQAAGRTVVQDRCSTEEVEEDVM